MDIPETAINAITPQPWRRRSVLPILLVIGIVTVVLVLSNLWLAWRSHDEEWQRAQSEAGNLAHSVTAQMDGMFAEATRVLNTIGFFLDRGEMSDDTLSTLQPLMVSHLSQAEYLHGLFVYGKDGSWLVHTQPTQTSQANNSDRDYFVAHRNSRSSQVRIGKPIISRSTGEWIIPVSKRLDDPYGEFAGVVLATIKVGYVVDLLNGFEIGKRGAIAVNMADGSLLLRRPYAAEDLGRMIPDNPLTALASSATSGSIRLTSPIDGVPRLVVFEHLSSNSLYVTVALAEDEIWARWRRGTEVQFLCVLLVVGVAVLAGSYAIYTVRVRRIADRELRLAHAQLVQANQQLSHMASHDGLTGLANRRSFDQRLPEIMGQCRRHKRPVSLLIFDVDFFKAFNDEYGHPEGDECLRRVANALSAAMRRPGDFVARYGGEEFVAVLPDTDASGARIVASTACTNVRQLEIPHIHGVSNVVTVSGGLACCTWQSGNETPASFITRADQALYRAKQAGRDRVEDDSTELKSTTA